MSSDAIPISITASGWQRRSRGRGSWGGCGDDLVAVGHHGVVMSRGGRCAREGDSNGVVAAILHQLEVRWKERGRKKNLSIFCGTKWVRQQQEGEVGYTICTKREWQIRNKSRCLLIGPIVGIGFPIPTTNRPAAHHTRLQPSATSTQFPLALPPSSLLLISAVLYLLPTLAPHGHLRCGLPKHASEYMQAISPSLYSVPKATPAMSANASCRCIDLMTIDRHITATTTAAEGQLTTTAVMTWPVPTAMAIKTTIYRDEAITTATKTGMMGAVKAMSMAGTLAVTGAMAGTAVRWQW
ncbi:hypothetical protein EDB89DRAFT_1913633 [Lactarius sanguifluus]|nr:hypothetical protein EDB89DRAFT_1913633 [Lactarius sanguifluus]